jgi:hypothetical protein
VTAIRLEIVVVHDYEVVDGLDRVGDDPSTNARMSPGDVIAPSR